MFFVVLNFDAEQSNKCTCFNAFELFLIKKIYVYNLRSYTYIGLTQKLI